MKLAYNAKVNNYIISIGTAAPDGLYSYLDASVGFQDWFDQEYSDILKLKCQSGRLHQMH